MRCDKCGRDFQWTEAGWDSHYKPTDKKTDGRPQVLIMCPKCAASRRGMLGYFILVIVLAFAALAIVLAIAGDWGPLNHALPA